MVFMTKGGPQRRASRPTQLPPSHKHLKFKINIHERIIACYNSEKKETNSQNPEDPMFKNIPP